jgi:hypothetical protein
LLGIPVLVRLRPVALLIVGLLPLSVVGACTDALAEPTPTLFTPPAQPTATAPVATATPRPTPQPTPPPWPAGWEIEFCTALGEVVVAQELTVDIPRALDEGDNDDALALARELRATAIGAGELLGGVTPWEEAQPAIAEMVTLADIGSRIGRQYVRFLEEGRRPALERVNALLDDMRPVLIDANAALAELDALGVDCSPTELILETP